MREKIFKQVEIRDLTKDFWEYIDNELDIELSDEAKEDLNWVRQENYMIVYWNVKTGTDAHWSNEAEIIIGFINQQNDMVELMEVEL